MSSFASKAGAGSFAATAIAAAVAVSPPAVAQVRPVNVIGNPVDVALRIPYRDLNLATKSGESTLRRRVWTGIHHMCRGEEISYQPSLLDVRCRTSSWTEAAPQIKQAVERARGLASVGGSPIAASAIVIAIPR